MTLLTKLCKSYFCTSFLSLDLYRVLTDGASINVVSSGITVSTGFVLDRPEIMWM